MQIGILGSGNIGASAAGVFARAGHHVRIANSRGPESLGSLVAETIAEAGTASKLVRIGVRRPPQGRSGSQRFYHALHDLNQAAIVERVLALVAGEPA